MCAFCTRARACVRACELAARTVAQCRLRRQLCGMIRGDTSLRDGHDENIRPFCVLSVSSRGFCRAACTCVRACETFAPVRPSLESSSGSGSHDSELPSVLSACVPIRNLIFPRERSIVAAVRTLEAHRAREQQNSRNSTVQRLPTFEGLPPLGAGREHSEYGGCAKSRLLASLLISGD